MKIEVLLFLLLLPIVSAQNYNIDPGINQNVAYCSEGFTQCDGNAFQMCVNANWQTTEQCEFGCSGQGCDSSPANQPPEYEQPPAEYVHLQVCMGGKTHCDGQKFQMCVNNAWQTQQTCGKYQQCTEKGCASITCEDKCENALNECIKSASGLFSMSDRINAKVGCEKAYGKCLEACGIIPPEAMPVVAPPKYVLPVEPTPSPHVESVEVEPLEIDERETTSKPGEGDKPVVEKPQGIIGKIFDFFKSLFGFGKKLTCPEECEKSYDDCVKEANKLFSIADRVKAKYWCQEANTACLDSCEEKEPELGRLREPPIAPPEKVEETIVMPEGEKSKGELPSSVSKPIIVPPSGDESMPELTCRGLCAKSYDGCIKEANKLFSIADRMKAKYWCQEANTACLDDCKKEEMKLPLEAMPSI